MQFSNSKGQVRARQGWLRACRPRGTEAEGEGGAWAGEGDAHAHLGDGGEGDGYVEDPYE